METVDDLPAEVPELCDTRRWSVDCCLMSEGEGDLLRERKDGDATACAFLVHGPVLEVIPLLDAGVVFEGAWECVRTCDLPTPLAVLMCAVGAWRVPLDEEPSVYNAETGRALGFCATMVGEFVCPRVRTVPCIILDGLGERGADTGYGEETLERGGEKRGLPLSDGGEVISSAGVDKSDALVAGALALCVLIDVIAESGIVDGVDRDERSTFARWVPSLRTDPFALRELVCVLGYAVVPRGDDASLLPTSTRPIT